MRELYPWPVLAQVDCDAKNVGRTQRIAFEGTHYEVTLESAQWQPPPLGTFRYRLRVESDGLGWHARSFSDEFDMCGTSEGAFVTLFHAKRKEPLEKIARAFFGRRWNSLGAQPFRSLAVSRFLAASIVGQVVEQAFPDPALSHYPGARLVGGMAPMFAKGSELWIGYRFFSEDAFAWARRSAGSASRVIVLFFADTKYQFRTDLPPRHSDPRLVAATKNRYRTFLERAVPDLTLASPEIEQRHPQEADDGYQSATDWLLTQTRGQERFALLFRENINYGFRRNVWALRPWAFGLEAITLAVIAAIALNSWTGDLQTLSIAWWASLGAIVLHAFFFALKIRKAWVRLAAEAFAQQLLAACDVLEREWAD